MYKTVLVCGAILAHWISESTAQTPLEDTENRNKCGLSLRSEGTTNSSSIKDGEFPWLAAIFYREPLSDRWMQRCMGTLITPHLVVTTAHCLVNYENERLQPSELKIGLGKFPQKLSTKDRSPQIYEVREVVIPKRYAGAADYFAKDIGLLDLVSSVQVTDFVMPACVDWTGAFKPAPDSVGTVAVWGKSEPGSAADGVMFTAAVKLIQYEQCFYKFERALKGTILTLDKFCGESDTTGRLPDRRDGGVGMTLVNNGRHFLVGIASLKVSRIPITVYTNVTDTDHSKWLEEERNRLKEFHRV